MSSSPRLRPLTVDEAVDLLKDAGLRRTFTRINLVRCLAERGLPMSHGEIFEQLANLGFDASTLFRGLNDLVDASVATRLDFGDRVWRFELRTLDAETTVATSHSHLVCRQCGAICCVHNDVIAPGPCSRSHLAGWAIEDALLKGVCPSCRADDELPGRGKS